jgi:hypothetical protein
MLKTHKEYMERQKVSPVFKKEIIKKKEIEEKIKYIFHCPEWEDGYSRNYEIIVNNETIKIENNVCYTYSKQVKNELIRLGYFLLKEIKET